MNWYFAYGSNMNAVRLFEERLQPEGVPRGERIAGRLDGYEGVAGGHYERRNVPFVRADTGATVEAVTYVALLVGEALRPTRDYLGQLLAGRDLLPPDYCARLGATPTID